MLSTVPGLNPGEKAANSTATVRLTALRARALTAGLLLAVYALSQAPQHGWGSARAISRGHGARKTIDVKRDALLDGNIARST